jgi:Ser/Thr protein kinase RdoA (MazF antagonist)
MREQTWDHLAAAADQFMSNGRLADIREYGSGNVHDTFLITLEAKGEEHLILQRINTQVFHQPELVMHNMSTVTEHIHRRLQSNPIGRSRRWVTPLVVRARDGEDHWIDPHGAFWRAMSFVGGARSFETIQDEGHAGEVGYALGTFQGLIEDLPMEKLADTLPGFHITPRYLRHYDQVFQKQKSGTNHSPELDYAMRFVRERRASANIIEEAKTLGKLCLRPIHGDPKVNNVMIDTATRQAVSLIDLDTVKPGLVLYDIGDCLRSCCNVVDEATERWESGRFETALCRAILKGYLSEARDFLTDNDYEYLYDSIRLIAIELGLRFLTDYLEGDVYFKVRHREHNLIRALIQFKLTESIETQEKAIRSVIQDLR